MEFPDVLMSRRSVRAFRPEPVAGADIDHILRCASAAPSAGGLQSWRVIVITGAGARQAIAAAAQGQSFVAGAPLVFVFLREPTRSAAEFGDRGARLFALQDATIACAYAQLAAADLGLSSCWVGAFDEDAVRAAIGAAPDLVPVAILPVGRAAEIRECAPRRPLGEIVCWERIGRA